MLMHGTITGTSDVDNLEYSKLQQKVEIRSPLRSDLEVL